MAKPMAIAAIRATIARPRSAAARSPIMADEKTIRERAYHIWEAEGRPHGRDREHWERANREIAAETKKTTGKTTAAAKAKPVGKPKSAKATRK
jgi:hypothetical protein